MNETLIFVTSDFKLNSAQGTRYLALFSQDISSQLNSLITYTMKGEIIKGWQAVPVIKPRLNSFSKYLKAIERRLIFPDSYIYKLDKYKSVISSQIQLSGSKHIVIGCTPFSLLLLAPWMKEIQPAASIIADLSDPFSFNMCNINSKIRQSIARVIERRGFLFIDHIVVLNEGIRDYYRRMYPIWADKFTVVEQGVDIDFIENVKAGEQKTKTQAFTFLYAGGFYRHGRNPLELYKAFQHKTNECNLQIFGNIRRSLRPKPASNSFYHKAIDKDYLAVETAKADALVLIDNDYGYQVPGKTLETLATNKPVLFIYNNENSPTLNYVREATGVIWAKNNANDIAAGVDKIVKYEYNTKNFDFSPYTWERMREKYQTLLNGDTR